MLKDSQRSHVHLVKPRIVDIMDDWGNDRLPDEDIDIPLAHQPANPDDDDVVPDQHAMLGIPRAQRPPEPAWRDLGLQELMHRGPGVEKSHRSPYIKQLYLPR